MEATPGIEPGFTRFINWFHDFGIPVGGVVVNMVIQKDQVNETSPEFVRNRVSMQDSYMEQIWKDFDGNVRAVIPLLDDEIRGTQSLDHFVTLSAEPPAGAYRPRGIQGQGVHLRPR